MTMNGWSRWWFAALLGCAMAVGCGDDDSPPEGTPGAGKSGAAGSASAHGGSSGRGGTSGASTAGGASGAGAEAGADETGARGGTKGRSGAGGAEARGGDSGAGDSGADGVGARPAQGGSGHGGTGGSAVAGEAGATGADDAGASGMPSQGGAGAIDGAGVGGAGVGGGSAGTGVVCALPLVLTPTDPTECVDASDCDRQLGPRGCGVWTCDGGSCAVAYRCADEDLDGFATGPDCACHGQPVDCDDGDSAVGATASAACCNGGTRACHAGVWGLCSGATGETCDGADNDCNGLVDDLGVFSCGLGVCRKTVPACSNGVLGVCIPDTPATTVDDCNGIDDDCDGSIDEDCARCIRVAPDGDDTQAVADGGATPFANVQAALDFTAAHRELANRVCVASGPQCGDTATYPGPVGAPLTMHEGVSLVGRYESTCWTPCDDSVTRLAPTTGAGVLFPPGIAVRTALDGFAIDRLYDGTNVAGVTVDGARGVVLSNLLIAEPMEWTQGGGSPGRADGIDIVNGASVTVQRSHVEAGLAQTRHALLVTDSQVLVEDNCAELDATTGRCVTSCIGSGPMLRTQPSTAAVTAGSSAITLQNSPGSRVERSSVCGVPVLDGSDVIHIAGASEGVVLRANFIGGDATGSGGYAFSADDGVFLEECAGSAPWLVDNEAITVLMSGNVSVIRATGDCHPVIEGNVAIGSEAGVGYYYVAGVRCEAGSVPSRCVIRGNHIQGSEEPVGLQYSLYVPISATGIACDGKSCARIERNSIVGLYSAMTCMSSACRRQGYALTLSGGPTTVAHNSITAGSAPNMYGYTAFVGTGVTGAAPDFEWNSVDSLKWTGGGTLSDNCIDTFTESDAASDPIAFTNNTLSKSYVDEGVTTLTDASSINALTDMTTSGNAIGACASAVGP